LSIPTNQTIVVDRYIVKVLPCNYALQTGTQLNQGLGVLLDQKHWRNR